MQTRLVDHHRKLKFCGALLLSCVVALPPGDGHAAPPETGAPVLGGGAAGDQAWQSGPPAPGDAATAATPLHEPCAEPGSNGTAVVDRVQRGVYAGVCGTARWFDGLFGTPRYDQDMDKTYGRLGLFETWDRRDGPDTRLRLRASVALPALQSRARLTFARVSDRLPDEERDQQNTGTPLPATFQNVDDEDWLLGLGYSKQQPLEGGFDFGIGVRLRFPVDPYVKASYRHNFVFTDSTMLRFRETLFWRDSRGPGTTTQLAIDHLLQPRLLLRWDNSGTVARDTEAMEWFSAVSLFQSLSHRRGLGYSVLAAGETGAEVGLQNYGFETRYRQRVLRDWLFMQLTASVTWPRYMRIEKRETNPGAGIGFEMYFGPVPDGSMR
jgi:hypothetical protein